VLVGKPKESTDAMKTGRYITPEDLRGQPGLSHAACDALVALQPTTVRRVLRIHGVSDKTTKRLLALGLLTDPDSIQGRRRTLEERRGE
jgi:hypothetical protein